MIHGLRTIAPVPLGMAASWDPQLYERVQAMAAREARAVGIHWAFAPMVEQAMADKMWANGEEFTMADCSAGPALFYADKVVPFGAARHAAAYLARLRERPSYARALREAEPYLQQFPG